MTSRNSTDSMENEFSVLRQMDGANVDPTCKELFTRISRRVTNVILDDKDFDIFTLKPELEQHLEEFCEWSSDLQETLKIDLDDIEIPENIMECEKDGINWIACAAARKFKDLNPSLGTKIKEIDDFTDYESSKFGNFKVVQSSCQNVLLCF